MKKIFFLALFFLLVLSLTAQGNTIEGKDNMENSKKTASDDAQMQTSDSSMPTRIIKEGTRINMHFGNTVIPGILNDGKTAQDLIGKLPVTVKVSRYSHDFCGVIGSLSDLCPMTRRMCGTAG